MFENLLSKGGLSFDRLRVIVQLDEAGSLVKAARGNSNRQSQFSRQLGELEDFFGLELTRRNGKTLSLTPSGKRLAEIAREALLTLEHFQSTATETLVRIKVGAGDSLLQWLLFPRLSQLRQQLPETQLLFRNLRTKEVSDCLCDLNLDLGLLRESGISPKLNSARVHRFRYSIFAARDLIPANRRTNVRWIFANVPFAFQQGDGQFQKQTIHAIEQQGIEPDFRIGCESFPEVCRVVQTGLYAAILPAIAERDLPARDFVRIDPPILRRHERIICLAWNPRIQRVRPGFDRIISTFKEVLTSPC